MSPPDQGFPRVPSSQALGSGALQDLPPRPGLCHEAAGRLFLHLAVSSTKPGAMFVESAAAADRKGPLQGAGYAPCCLFLLLSSNFFRKHTFLLTAKTPQRPAAQGTIPPGAFSSFVNTDLSRPFSQGHLGLSK